jgi:hypothetical protein
MWCNNDAIEAGVLTQASASAKDLETNGMLSQPSTMESIGGKLTTELGDRKITALSATLMPMHPSLASP